MAGLSNERKCMKHKKTQKFKDALSRTFLLSTVIPIGILMVAFTIYVILNIRESNIITCQNTLSVMMDTVESELDSINGLAVAYENDSKIRSYFYYFYLNNGSADDDSLISYKNHLAEYAQAMNSYLKVSALSDIIGIGFIPDVSEGKIMMYHELGGAYAPVAMYDEEQTEWFKKIGLTGEPMVITYEEAPYLRNPRPVLAMTDVVWNNSKTAPIGYVKIDVSEKIFKNLIEKITLIPDSDVVVSIKDTNFVYAHDPYFISNELMYSPDEEAFEGDSLRINGKRYHVEKKISDKYGVTLYYVVRTSKLYSGLTSRFIILYVLFFVMFVLAFFALRSFSGSVVKDFSPIKYIFSKYKGGEKVEQSAVTEYSIVEIENLSKMLDSMIDEIEGHIETEYKTKIEQKKAEFRALQSEINPHFLYNTLNNFLALNRVGERKLLEESIVSLAKMFRYTCEKNETGISTVEEEFVFLENYLKLQKLRYDDRLTYQMTIDPCTSECSIPKLILQPLVENAIIHGLEPCEHPVHIQISSSSFKTKGIGEIYLLSVINDGCPFDAEEANKNMRVGLGNIEKRLHTFWPESVMIAKGGEGKLTEFHLVIKKNDTEGGPYENTDRR